jgi:hypothetical protein
MLERAGAVLLPLSLTVGGLACRGEADVEVGGEGDSDGATCWLLLALPRDC